MFEFKILQSPERAQHGTYEHNSDELIFGSSEGEMIVDDSHLGPSQFRLFFQNGQAYGQNLFPDCEVKVNQTVIGQEPHPVKVRDSIAMGRTVIVLSKIKPGPLEPPKLEAGEKPKDISQFKEGTPQRAICEVLDFLAGGKPAASAPPTPPGVPPVPTPPKVPPPPPRK